MHQAPWIIGSVVAIAASAAYSALSVPGVRRALDLATEGGDLELNQPMRPQTAGPRVLIIAIDGVGRDQLELGLQIAPHGRLRALFGRSTAGGFEHAYAAPDVLTILPSTTVAVWASVFTGQPPARTGVPGNEWFDRHQRRFYAPAPVSVDNHDDALATYNDDLVGRALAVPTLYQRAGLRSFVSLSQIHHGADYFSGPPLETLPEALGALADGMLSDAELDGGDYALLDAGAVDGALRGFDKHGVPPLQVVYLPGADLAAHVSDSPLGYQLAYVATVVDPQVGRLLDAYAAHGLAEQTYVLIVSDHGHTPVIDDDLHALSAAGDDEPSAVLEQAGFRVRRPKLGLDAAGDDYQAVLALQGAMAYVYLADRSGCASAGQACNWSRPPRLREDLLPAARALWRASHHGEGVAEMAGTLDLVMARIPAGAGAALSVFDGEQFIPLPAYLAAHPRPELLQLEARLDGLVDGPLGDRAGDLLLLTRTGMDRPIEERYYFSREYRSWHGSPRAQDSRVPFVLAHASRSGRDLRALVEAELGDQRLVTQVTPLVLRLLAAD